MVLPRLASRCSPAILRGEKTPAPALAPSRCRRPLANRLGIWQIKWELEDLSFRFLQPDDYHTVARLLDEKRVEREHHVEAFRGRLADQLRAAGLRAEVQGRPKHLYSIWKKMQGKGLDFPQVFDVRAMRIIVDTVRDCYAVLSRVHELYRAVPDEFDDYIAKPNGYQSLHTVVLDETTAVRCRSHPRDASMPSTAWRRTGRTKEAGAGAGGVSAGAISTPRSPRRAWRCFASCSRGDRPRRAG